MFVNITNHPSAGWSAAQREACEAVAGPVVDLPFPPVPPEAGEEAVEAEARRVAERAEGMGARAALVQGEFTLVWALVRELRGRGVRCFAATTERGGEFRFVRLREYR